MRKEFENIILLNRSKRSFQVVLLTLAFVFSSQAFSQVIVRYTVTPDVRQMSAFVKVRVDGLEPENTPEIEISEQFGSANDFYRDVSDLKIVTPTGATLINSSPRKWHVNSKLDDGIFEYEYRIKIHQNLPNEKVRFKPSLNPQSYYSNGYPLFIFPSHYLEQTEGIKVEQFIVDFKLPSGWRSVTSLNKFVGGRWKTKKIDALLASTIALGNYRYTTHRLPNGTPFRMILNGKWPFSDKALADAAHKIVSAQINMMGAWHFPLYSVVLSQSPERGASGSGLENAFEMFGDAQRTLEDFYYLISHENFHYWNGNRIRYGDPRTRWFSEGFTEYYTYVTVGRMKLGSMQTNLDVMSKVIQAYSENPIAEKITFKQAGKHFWDWLPEYGHLFYSKGMLIALMADVHLRSSSRSLSLDGFMRFLDHKYFNSGKAVDDNTLAAELENYSGFDWQDFFDQFIFGTSVLPVNDYARLGGMEIIDVSCKRPDLGFTMMPYFCADKTPCGYQAVGVTKNGPAYRSGIREGDVIARSEPSFVQKMPPHTPVKFGINGPDGGIVWHEYISEEKSSSCKQLAFEEDPDSSAQQIRESIWQAGESNP